MDRFTWGIVAGAAALVVAGLVSAALLTHRPAPPNFGQPEGVVQAYVQALDDDHPERAWDLLAAKVQADVPRDEFIRRATTSVGYGNHGSVTITGTEIDGDVAVVHLDRSYGSGRTGLFGGPPAAQHITVRLERENGVWRIAVPPDPYLVQRGPR